MIQSLMVIFLIVFGVLTSLEDIFQQRVRNRWVVLAICFGIMNSIAIYFSNNIQPSQILEFYLSCLFATLFGYLIWQGRLWSAGDAKLFIAYAFIIHPILYLNYQIPFFQSFTIIINTFTPMVLFYLLYIPFKAGLKKTGSILKFAFSPKLIACIALFIFGFGWLTGKLLPLIKIPSNFFIQVVALFLILLLFSKYLKLKLLPVSLIISIIRIAVEPSSSFSPSALARFGLLLLTFIIFRFYLLTLSFELFSKDVKLSDLREGMIPAQDVINDGNKRYGTIGKAYYSFVGALLRNSSSDSVFYSVGDGISKQEIKLLKGAHKKGLLKDDQIRIYETIPFAPFMFFGALLTVAIKTDIILFVRMLIETFI